MSIRSIHRPIGVKATLSGITIACALMAALALGVLTAGCGASTSGATTASTTSSSSSGSASSAAAVAVSQVSTAQLGTSPAEAVAASAGPSVVNVRVTGVTSSGRFGSQPYEGIGSGVIWTADGYIITNAHVVSENGTPAETVEVTFSSGKTLPATIVATDSVTEIAIIKVDASGLTPATFADSSTIEIGEYAIAIGSPSDYSNSVTLGIVSGLGRSIQNAGSTALVDLIQTDAAISPGNSGGALLDGQGKVIGINVAYLPPSTTGAENIGFAIPSNTALSIAQELLSNGHANHPSMGIAYTTVTPLLQQQYRLSRATGVLVTSVDPQGPGAASGLRQGDIIVSVDGAAVKEESDITLALRQKKEGDTMSLTIDRDGSPLALSLTLGVTSGSAS